MADKRNEKRKKKRLRITYSAFTEDMFNGFSSDISPSGVFIRTKRPFRPGVPVNISLEVNEGRKIELAGITAWSVKTGFVYYKKDGMGVRLVSPPQIYNDFLRILQNEPFVAGRQ